MALIISVAFPLTKQFVSRGFTDVGETLNLYQRSRFWLIAPTLASAIETAKDNKAIIETLPDIRSYIPINDCVYTLQTLIVMLYAKRIAGIFSPIVNSEEELIESAKTCRFFLAGPVTDLYHSYPVYYPMQLITNEELYQTIPFCAEDRAESELFIFLIKRSVD